MIGEQLTAVPPVAGQTASSRNRKDSKSPGGIRHPKKVYEQQPEGVNQVRGRSVFKESSIMSAAENQAKPEDEVRQHVEGQEPKTTATTSEDEKDTDTVRVDTMWKCYGAGVR